MALGCQPLFEPGETPLIVALRRDSDLAEVREETRETSSGGCVSGSRRQAGLTSTLKDHILDKETHVRAVA